MGTVIKAESIAKSYGMHDIFESVSFSIPSGVICGFIGPSGSGKTTLLHAILGFCPLDDGAIQIAVQDTYVDALTSSNQLKKNIGFSSQAPSVYQQLTVRENLLYFASIYGVKRKQASQRAQDLLRLVGLYDYQHQSTESLSKGMLKRLDIACALVHDPQILVLDEPTADLDPVLRKQMWKLLVDIKAQGKTILLTSHFLDEVDQYCDLIGVLHKGKLVHFCSPSELHQYYKIDRSILVRLDPPHYNQVIEVLSKNKHVKITAAHQTDDYLYLSSKELLPLLLMLASYCKKRKISIVDMQSSTETLNSIFEALVNNDTRID